ncbi:unnamed protein product [Ixodes pacificus]
MRKLLLQNENFVLLSCSKIQTFLLQKLPQNLFHLSHPCIFILSRRTHSSKDGITHFDISTKRVAQRRSYSPLQLKKVKRG